MSGVNQAQSNHPIVALDGAFKVLNKDGSKERIT